MYTLAQCSPLYPEALYTLQYFNATNADFSHGISYVNVPLLARLHAKGFCIEAGPEVNFALTAQNEAGDTIRSDVNPVVLGYVVGLGVHYDGATNVFKENNTNIIGTKSLKFNSFWINLSYVFGKQVRRPLASPMATQQRAPASTQEAGALCWVAGLVIS